jgi:hypothetical protein
VIFVTLPGDYSIALLLSYRRLKSQILLELFFFLLDRGSVACIGMNCACSVWDVLAVVRIRCKKIHKKVKLSL